jgi:hypothetical protein
MEVCDEFTVLMEERIEEFLPAADPPLQPIFSAQVKQWS